MPSNPDEVVSTLAEIIKQTAKMAAELAKAVAQAATKSGDD